MAVLVELAPAKVNLTLRVLGRRADGYHLLESLVVFADVGDRLTLAPGGALDRSTVRGADGGAGRAARRQSRAQGRARACRAKCRVSSSAASRSTSACRSRPASAADRPMPPRRCGCSRAPTASRSTTRGCSRSARAIGADVPVCVDPRPRRMRGIGEVLSRAARACRSLRRCWSIPVSRCRPGTCSRRSASRPAKRRRVPGGRKALAARAATASSRIWRASATISSPPPSSFSR